MTTRIIIYFAIFGLLFGLFNFIDAWLQITGGYDTPRSMIFNMPTMIVHQGVYSATNALEQSRFRALKKEVGLPPDANLVLTKRDSEWVPKFLAEEWESLTPEEQQEFLSKMEQHKYLARNDPIVGQNGLLKLFYRIYTFSHPIVSAIAWGIIGAIVYLIGLAFTVFRRKRSKKLPQ